MPQPSGLRRAGGQLDPGPIPDRRPCATRCRSSCGECGAAGFTELRTIVAYRRPVRNQLSGALMSTTGDVSPRDRQNVRAFVGDIARAGYRGLEIVYGFMEQNSPGIAGGRNGATVSIRREPRRTGASHRKLSKSRLTRQGRCHCGSI